MERHLAHDLAQVRRPETVSGEPAGLAGGLLARDSSTQRGISGDAGYVGRGEISCKKVSSQPA
jgi:hypothetical protein